MDRFNRRKLAIGIALAALVAAGFGGRTAYKLLRWKRFATVEETSLWRSGQLHAWQLESAIERYGLKTVVCFNDDYAEQEQRICESRGVDFRYLPMPSSGLGDTKQFLEFMQLVTDPRHRPLLVHCNAGVARTGAAIALYRRWKYGWTQDRAISEVRSFERRGRCEPSLQRHIARVFDEIVPTLQQSTGIASKDESTSIR